MVKISGGQAVVECLKAEDVRHIFFVAGSCVLPVLDALYDTPEIQGIAARHEQSAAHMADAYARVTGGPGICLVHNGPGITNTISGVATAALAHSPLILLSGAPLTSQMLRDSVQEVDQISLLRPIVKWNALVNEASRIPELMRNAFRVAMTGRKGPVHLDLPRNLLYETIEYEPLPRELYRTEARPHSGHAIIEKAGELLLEALRPVIIAGAGVKEAEATEDIIRLAELLKAPIVVSYGQLDAIPGDHPLAAGQLGRDGSEIARQLVLQADVILAIGTRLGHFTTYYSSAYVPTRAKIIQVEIEPREIGRNFPATLGIWGDAKSVTQTLAAEVHRRLAGSTNVHEDRYTQVVRAIQDWKAKMMQEAVADVVPTKPQRIYREIREALPRNAIIVMDDGSSCAYCYHMLEFYEPRTFISPLEFACVGFGYPAALGAKVARPDRQVVNISGDFGFLMSAHEIATAIKYDIPVVAVVLNNGCNGAEKAYQRAFFKGRYYGCELVNPDFSKLAESFGAFGARVERPSEFRELFAEALESGKPALIEVPIDPEELGPPARTDAVPQD